MGHRTGTCYVGYLEGRYWYVRSMIGFEDVVVLTEYCGLCLLGKICTLPGVDPS